MRHYCNEHIYQRRLTDEMILLWVFFGSILSLLCSIWWKNNCMLRTVGIDMGGNRHHNRFNVADDAVMLVYKVVCHLLCHTKVLIEEPIEVCHSYL